MMLKVAKLGIAIAAVLAWIVPAAYAGVPDTQQSFYVPQRGSVGTPTEGPTCLSTFRGCPANDLTSWANSSRIKVVVKDVNGNGIPGIAAADVCILFNGGTAAQGFSGVGADSVIANSTWNQTPLCPDIRCLQADDQTDASGTTYITFTGSTPGSPGVGLRNTARRWGHYDTAIPVYVLGFQLQGRLTTGSANGTYTLQLKNLDTTGGLAATLDQGEVVSATDFNAIANGIGVNNLVSFWRDFDSSGGVAAADFNLISQHVGHNCATAP